MLITYETMKPSLLALILALSAMACSHAEARITYARGRVAYRGAFPKAARGRAEATLKIAGQRRRFAIRTPMKLEAGAPLVIALHGSGCSASDALWNVRADALAEKHGLIVIAPQARRMKRGDWDSHGPGEVFFETHPATNANKNADLRMLRALIKEAHRAYGVDKKRVYAFGFSNGAFFASFAARMLPKHIAGFASASGGLVTCPSTRSCKFIGTATSCAALSKEAGWCGCSGPKRPLAFRRRGRKIPAFIAHATTDPIVSVYYACVLARELKSKKHPFTLEIAPGGKHEARADFGEKAWRYLSKYKLP